MFEPEAGCVKHETIRHRQGGFMGVHIASEDGVPQLSHVNAQLVRTSGDRLQQYSSAVRPSFQNCIAG